MQLDPMKPKFEPPGTKRLKLKCDELLSTSAFKFNLRRYNGVDKQGLFDIKVGRCRLTLSNPH